MGCAMYIVKILLVIICLYEVTYVYILTTFRYSYLSNINLNRPCRVVVRFSLIPLHCAIFQDFSRKSNIIFQRYIRSKLVVLYEVSKFASEETDIMAGISM
jgi:hypothetical protein